MVSWTKSKPQIKKGVDTIFSILNLCFGHQEFRYTDYRALSIWEEITFKGSVPEMKERFFCQMSVFNPEFLLLLQSSTQSSPLSPPSPPLSSSVSPLQPYNCLHLHLIHIAKADNNSYLTAAFPWWFSTLATPQQLSHRKFTLFKNVILINFLVFSKIINSCCS